MIQYKQYIFYFLLAIMIFSLTESTAMHKSQKNISPSIALPAPDISLGIPLNSAMQLRRSYRQFATKPISLDILSQLLWSAQGINHPSGFRTVPSAGALFPLEIYIVVGNVDDLPAGIYHFEPVSNSLHLVIEKDQRKQLALAAHGQNSINQAAITLVITGIIRRTEKKYGQRAKQYVHIEAGNASQNIYLQATSLKLGTVFIGAFSDKKVKRVLQLSSDHEPLGLMPVGSLP